MTKKATSSILSGVTFLLSGVAAYAQTPSIPFIDRTSQLSVTTYHSGNCIAVCDMNNDKKDDIVRSDNTTMAVQTQGSPNGSFTGATYTYNLSGPWGSCVADINNDGINDMLWGDNGAVRMMTWNGSTYVGSNLSTLTGSGFVFVQGANFFDIDNDSYVDAFVCADTDSNQIFMNNSGSSWTYNPFAIPPGCGLPGTGNSFDGSGNYASIFSDINNDGRCDLMVTHCRQSVSSNTDMRRIDQVYINNGNGTWTQDITNWTGLRDGAQGWSTAWGDIDNDGDMDAFVLNYDVNSTLMINNGSGVFTNMISGSGISNTSSFFGMNATFQDFDNDGFVDLMLTGDNHYLYKNNGNGTFTQVTPNPFNYSTNTITSHAVGDLNSDGFLDLYASYCNVYNSPSTKNDKLWMNDGPANGNTNHYIIFDLVGGAVAGMSNKNGIGSIVKIYGPWGVQVREVRSGEGYGITNSFAVHFGLGAETQIDSVKVIWPSGMVDQLDVLPADNHYTINEGGNPLNVSAASEKPLTASVIPNPVNANNGIIRIDNYSNIGLENLSLHIYDMSGKLIYGENRLNNSIITLQDKNLSEGMYFYEVSAAGKRLASGKFIRN
jgi:hypothetical protein